MEETAENVVESVEPEHIFVIDETKDIEAHTFVDGKCSVCRYECRHENVDYKSEDSTESFKHTSICNDCGLILSEECVVNEDWQCEKCGRDMRYVVLPIEQQTLYSAVSYSKRDLPSMSESEVIGKYEVNDEVTIVGEVLAYKDETDKFYKTDDGAFIKQVDKYLSTEKIDTSRNYTSYGAEIVWEGGQVGQPYSIGGLRLLVINDDGGDNIYIYRGGRLFPETDNAKLFGQLQRQAEELFKSRGHGSANWHVEDALGSRREDGVSKWYLTE